mmetsp:Transcript_78630/g.168516  ORF Transcript_78630/g.168516 Transcript_78630/m.168516 type:complete len:486 (-) Transcript_78630:68-1525(-)
MADSFAGNIKVAKALLRRCLGAFLQGSPPEPCEEVQALLMSLRIKPGHLLKLYGRFIAIRQTEVEELVTRAWECDIESVVKMVPERRKWVARLMRSLLRLGEVEESVSWDQFLWIFLKFCSLNRVELCQALFLICLKEGRGNTLHYASAGDLQEFFKMYKECPVPAFNTEAIDFDKLPLTRYYASDFAELMQRFSVLLNPILHLQQVLQSQLPSSDFWDNSDPSSSFCRKITFEFFTMNPTRVYLRGEPPFRETCDMLAPDALGCEAVNQDQWILRTKDARMGRGLRQVSVWGEQPPPELISLLEQVKAARKAAEEAGKPVPPLPGAELKTATPGAGAALAITTGAPGAPGAPGASNLPGAVTPAPGGTAMPKAGSRAPGSATEAWAGNVLGMQALEAGKFTPVGKVKIFPNELSIEAVTIDEEGEAPAECLPPPWMRNCTVAPAPVRRGADPPLQTIGHAQQALENSPFNGTSSSLRNTRSRQS